MNGQQPQEPKQWGPPRWLGWVLLALLVVVVLFGTLSITFGPHAP